MMSRLLGRGAGLVLAVLIAFAVHGCSKKAGLHSLIPNQRPTVILTSGPIYVRDTVSFSITLRWTADDPDGRVDHFIYAIDPKDHDTTWITTTANLLEERFSSRDPLPPGALGTTRLSVQPHTFVLRAIDNQGLASVPNTRSFTSSTISPTVSITSPLGSDLIQVPLPPTVHIEWQGDDPDGVTSRKPTYYLWKLFKQGNTEFNYDLLKSSPDSLRRFYAKTNFAGWDTVPGPRGINSFVDLPTLHSPNLELGKSYMFVVVAFDTAKAYSPVFNYTSGGNMLEFLVSFVGTLGPPITAFNDSFFYRMISGGLGIPENSWVRLEVPADRPVTFNWTVTGGSRIEWYRWRINGNWQDETPRDNESDWYHWSAPGAGTTSCTFGPFPGDTVLKRLMIEAMDANGLFSILTIAITPVVPTFAKNLLIVDDCRPEVDQYTAAGALRPYTQFWPSATELDTFLYARGGVQWNGTLVPPTAPVQPVSRPGLFAGYTFDTLGTRLGLQIASAGVPLSVLGRYRNIIWMVDKNGGANTLSPIDLLKPSGTLHWMCTPNHQNTLGSYMSAGGSVWLLGGDAAFASMREFNAKLAANNDSKYLGISGSVYSSLPPANELIPGRLMYGGAHWRSEMITHVASTASATIIKSPRAPAQPWASPGFHYSHPLTSPDYSLLPPLMRKKDPAIGDTLPPTRTNQFFGAITHDVEYLTQPNEIIEDYDRSPFSVDAEPALDTLMDVSARTGLAPTGNEAAIMTYYHGVEGPEFIFSGFNFWAWSRTDCQQLVDFVLQHIWKMPPPSANTRSNLQTAVRPVVPSPASARRATTPAAAWSRLPNSRTGGR